MNSNITGQTQIPREIPIDDGRLSHAITVESGMSRWGETISSNHHRAWTKISGRDTNGDWFMSEAIVPSRHGVPLHVHDAQEEWFWVLSGQFNFEIGGKLHQLSPGASLLAPRKIPHRWQNVHTSNGRLLVLAQPAGLLEQFFDALYALSPEDYNNPELIMGLFEQSGMKVLGPALEGTQF